MAQDKGGPAAGVEATNDVGVTVLLPVMDEENSLVETVRTLERVCAPAPDSYLILLSSATSQASRAVCARLATGYPGRMRLHQQTLPGLGGALREGFDLTDTTHVVLMASDLETDPGVVPAMLERSRANPSAIVTASRWLQPGSFAGYPLWKRAGNRLFQVLFAWLYGVRLTDLTYGFRVFPAALVKQLAWEETGHAFLFETLAKPLARGVPVIEVPARWRPRPEGVSRNPAASFLRYCLVGLREWRRMRVAAVHRT